MRKKLFYLAVVLVTAMLSFISCINEDYKISEGRLDLEANLFEEGLAAPLGNTEKIFVRDLLDQFYPDSEEYIQEVDGGYVFNMTEAFDFSDSLKNLKNWIDVPDVSVSEDIKIDLDDVHVDYPVVSRAGGSAFTIKFERNVVMTLLDAEDVPEYIVSMDRVEFEDVYVNISFDTSALPDIGDADMVLDLVLDIPEMMVLAPGQQDPDGKVRLEGRLDANGMLDAGAIKVDALILDGVDLKNGISLTVPVEGNVSVSNASITARDWLGENREHNITLTISIKDIEFSMISGRADYKMEPVVQTIDLAGLSFGSNVDVVADLSHVHLAVELNTNIDASVYADIELIPYYGKKAGTPMPVNVAVEGSDSASSIETTRFWFGSDDACCPDGYIFKKIDLRSLLNPIPDRVQVKVSGGTDPDALCTLYPSADYILDAKCMLDVPFEFGDDFKVEFRDTLQVNAENLSVILETGNLVLTGTVESTLPFNLNMEAVLLDETDREVPFEEGSGILEIHGSADGTPATTDIEIKFVKKEGTSVPEIGAVDLVFSLKSAADAVRLTPESYVQAELQILVPDGITLDLDDYLNE